MGTNVSQTKTDHVTILSACGGSIATKRYRRRRFDDPSRGLVREDAPYIRAWSMDSVPVSSFDDLSEVIEALERNPRAIVVTGEPKAGVDRSCALRRSRERKTKTEDGGWTYESATLDDLPRRWLAIDLDDLPIAIDPVVDPEGCVEAAILMLGPEFHSAKCRWTFTSGAGMSAERGVWTRDPSAKPRLRLWFWLARAMSSEEKRAWARSWGKPLDPSLYNAAQPHYTAFPLFSHAADDPLSIRSGVRTGAPEVDNVNGLTLGPIAVTASDRKRDARADRAKKGAKDGDTKTDKRFGKRQPKPFAVPDTVALAVRGVPQRLAMIGYSGFRSEILGVVTSAVAQGHIHAVGCDEAEAVKAEIRRVASTSTGGRTPAYVERVLSDEHLDEMIRWALDGERAAIEAGKGRRGTPSILRQRIRGLREADSAAPATRVPASDVSAAMAGNAKRNLDLLWNAVETDRRLVVVETSTAGCGKSRTFLQTLADDPRTGLKGGGRIGYLTPTHKVAEELADDLRRMAPHLKVVVYKGKIASGCKREAEVKALGDANVASYELCQKGPVTCPYIAQCAYKAQLEELEAADVVFMAHNFIDGRFGLPEPLKNIAFVSIDERIWDKVVTRRSLPLVNAEADLQGQAPARRAVLKALIGALRAGTDPVQAVHETGMLDSALAWARSMSCASVSPSMSTEELLGVAKRAGDHRLGDEAALLAFLTAMTTRFADGRLYRHPWIASRGGVETIEWVQRLECLQWSDKPVLLLDADADISITKRLFPGRDVEANGVQPVLNARFIQVVDTTMRTGLMTDEGEVGLATISTIRRVITRLARKHTTLLVVLPLAGEKLVRDGWDLPEGVAIDHYGALRGTDAYKAFEAVILLGRPQPAAQEAYALAAAIFDFERVQADDGETYPQAPGYFDMRDGRRFQRGTPYPHDSRVRVVLEQVREAELTQALHRLRLVHRETTAHVYVGTAIPLPGIVLDDVVTLESLAGGGDLGPLGETLRAAGVLPTTAGLLHAVAKARFSTEAKARTTLSRHGVRAFDVAAGRVPDGLIAYSAKLHGTRRPEPVLAEPGQTEVQVRKALEAHGVDVLWVKPISTSAVETTNLTTSPAIGGAITDGAEVTVADLDPSLGMTLVEQADDVPADTTATFEADDAKPDKPEFANLVFDDFDDLEFDVLDSVDDRNAWLENKSEPGATVCVGHIATLENDSSDHDGDWPDGDEWVDELDDRNAADEPVESRSNVNGGGLECKGAMSLFRRLALKSMTTGMAVDENSPQLNMAA